MECEVCGRPANQRARIEGIVVSVCDACAQLGEPVKELIPKTITRPRKPDLEIVADFSTIIKDARSERGLSLQELASQIKEKENFLKRVENGSTEPPFALAKKLEKSLGIKLIEEPQKFSTDKKIPAPKLTLGDVAEVKERDR